MQGLKINAGFLEKGFFYDIILSFVILMWTFLFNIFQYFRKSFQLLKIYSWNLWDVINFGTEKSRAHIVIIFLIAQNSKRAGNKGNNDKISTQPVSFPVKSISPNVCLCVCLKLKSKANYYIVLSTYRKFKTNIYMYIPVRRIFFWFTLKAIWPK